MIDKDVYLELIGCRVGDYVIDSYIDAGGQAVVYTAHLPQFPQRKYALKIFGLIQSGSEIGLNEAKKLAAVEHSSVARFHMPGVDEIEVEGNLCRVLYIPMDFANLGNCDKNPPFKKDKHLSDMDYKAMLGLLDGLQAIHKYQLIHEDIKPANILQFEEQVYGESRMVLRITDFGIAKVLSSFGGSPPEVSGMTREFMSPEQADHIHSVKGDIYSMGATLFYMITGELPIERPSGVFSDPYASLIAWQQNHKNQPRPNAMKHSVFCPPRLALLIMRMMSVKPEDRPDLEVCKKELWRIMSTNDKKAIQRLEIPDRLKTELVREEFPIRYVPQDFSEIFKPKIHEICGSQLFVIRIKMGHPVYSQYKVLIEYMIRRLSDCFSLYETWGTYDVNILLWGKYDYDEAKSLKKILEERLAGSRVQIRPATKVHDLHCVNPSIPDDADPVLTLAVQEGIELPGLKKNEYLCKSFPKDVPEYSVRAFTYVEPAEPSADKFIRNAIIRNIQAELAELIHPNSSQGTVRFRRATMIELLPQIDVLNSENDTTILLVSFVASQYRYLSDVPTAIIRALGENAVKTSTFLETRRVVIQSDKILF